MSLTEQFGRLRVIVGLVILLFLPVLFVGLTISFLSFSEALVLAELSTVELIELYVIDLALFAAAVYVLYRLMRRLLAAELDDAGGKNGGR